VVGDPCDPRGWGARTSLTFWWVLCYGGRYYGLCGQEFVYV
jgi:hypothetical protein